MDADYNDGIYRLATAIVNQAITATTNYRATSPGNPIDFYFYKKQFEKGLGRVWFVVLGAESLYDDLQEWYAEHGTVEQSIEDIRKQGGGKKIPRHYTTTSSVIMSCKYYAKKQEENKKPF